ncbi:hypothetical protein BDY17DRAFT_257635, partial [Neohortaea acidophila]
SLAAYALYSANRYSLPIPNAVCALAMALPPLAGVALEAVLSLNDSLARKGQVQASRVFQVVVAAFLIFESVLATLAGTHYSPPGSLNCALGERWMRLFDGREVEDIRRIQDAFSCCGLKNPQDMSWPFPDANHGANACQMRFQRDNRCLEPWREEERKVAIMLMVVPIGVFIWKIAILLAPSSQSSWLPSQITLPEGSEHGDTPSAGSSRAAFRPHGVQGLEGNEAREDSLYRTVTDLNNDSQLASRVESQRTKSAGLLDEPNFWSERREG